MVDGELLEAFSMGLSQSALEAAECGRRVRVLAHPPVVDEPDRDGVQEVELFPAASVCGHDQARFLELLEVFSSRRRAVAKKRASTPLNRLPVLTEELVVVAPRRVGQCLEHFVHAIQI